LVVKRLFELALPGSVVEQQVPCDRLRIDLAVHWQGRRVFVEFVGPSHFLPDYDREPTSPLQRKLSSVTSRWSTPRHVRQWAYTEQARTSRGRPH
jgi:hypothetical protein